MGKIWITKGELRSMVREMVEGRMCDGCGMPEMKCECGMSEVAPPGREKQVKGLKRAIKRGDLPKDSNPWAIAWSQHDKE